MDSKNFLERLETCKKHAPEIFTEVLWLWVQINLQFKISSLPLPDVFLFFTYDPDLSENTAVFSSVKLVWGADNDLIHIFEYEIFKNGEIECFYMNRKTKQIDGDDIDITSPLCEKAIRYLSLFVS